MESIFFLAIFALVFFYEKYIYKKYKNLDEKNKELNNSLSIFKNDFKDKKLEEYIEKEKEFTTLKAEIDTIKFQNKKQSITSLLLGKYQKY